MIAVFKRDVLNHAPIIDSNIIWSEKLRALTDCGFEMLKTNQKSVPGFLLLPNCWGSLQYDYREDAVATSIVGEIQGNGGGFYQFNMAENSWGTPILNVNATAHVRIPSREWHSARWKDYVETH